MRPLVLDRIADHAICRACLHRRPFALSDWAYMAAKPVAAAARGGGDAKTLCTDFGREYTVRSRIGPASAACGACGAEIVREAIVAGVATGAASCACGATMPVRAADELVRAIAPTAIAVANERPVREHAHAMVAFRCACGESLGADGTARAVTCWTCGPVDVPEALWNTLRPIVRRSPMYLVLGKKR